MALTVYAVKYVSIRNAYAVYVIRTGDIVKYFYTIDHGNAAWSKATDDANRRNSAVTRRK